MIKQRISQFLILASLLISMNAEAKPQRVVSLNLCADQLILQLAEPGAIASLSSLSRDSELSLLAERAAAFPQNSGSSEEVLTLKPDLVIAGKFTARPAVEMLKRRGYQVIELEIPGSLEAMKQQFREVAALLGEVDKGEFLLVEMEKRMAAVAPPENETRPTAAVYYANGFTAGSESIVSAVLDRAGFENLSLRTNVDRFGFYPLEKVIEEQPDLLIFGSFNAERHSLAQKMLEHPALVKTWGEPGSETSRTSVSVPDKLWICATPAIAEVVEILATKREELVTNNRH